MQSGARHLGKGARCPSIGSRSILRPGGVMAWPKDTQEELRNFYGAHALRADGRPTAVWERDHLKTIDLPYPMLLAWDLSKQVRKLTCHKLAADSVGRIFAGIL